MIRLARAAHRAGGWTFGIAGTAAVIAADGTAAFETVLTLAAVAGWGGVTWLLTNPALNEGREENGQ